MLIFPKIYIGDYMSLLVLFQFIPFFVVLIIILTRIPAIYKRNKNKSHENEDRSFKNTISNANDPDSYGNSISSEPTEVYCDYCGSRYSKTKKRCPSCGARTTKLK